MSPAYPLPSVPALRRLVSTAALVAGVALLAGCATDPSKVGTTANAGDPWEGFNRKVYAVNTGLDTVVMKPVAKGYRFVVPAPMRDYIHNALDNLNEPVVFMNQVLQGQFKYAGTTFLRFVANSTFGVGGINDFASIIGFKGHSGDFGQTLAVYGVNSGPYLMLPLFGPSTVRDGIGMGVDTVADPWNYVISKNIQWVTYARFGLTAVDARERALDQLDEINRTSIDPYASIRSLYLQHRDAEVRRLDNSAAGASPVDGSEFDLPPATTPKPANSQ